MFIKLGNLHINPANVTHFIANGDVITVYFVGGTSVVLEGEDAMHLIAELSLGGRY